MPEWYFLNSTRVEIAHASVKDVSRLLQNIFASSEWRADDKIDMLVLDTDDFQIVSGNYKFIVVK
jgi:hypothetical protein